jgi:hypothetical protein
MTVGDNLPQRIQDYNVHSVQQKSSGRNILSQTGGDVEMT